MSDEPLVLIEADHGVMTIRLNRPQALNALTHPMRDAFLSALGQADRDPQVRCVLLTGAGRAFSVGQDVREMQDMYAERGPHLGELVTDQYNPMVSALFEMPKPVIALVNGPAAGGGLSLALACDVRIITDQTTFIPAFVKVGLAPDTGASYLLPRMLGWSRALALSISGQSVGPDQAMDWGLAHYRFATLEEATTKALELAHEFAKGPTRAMAEIRQLLLQSQTLSWDQALSLEAKVQDALGRGDDHQEAVRAFVERRTPNFHGQ